MALKWGHKPPDVARLAGLALSLKSANGMEYIPGQRQFKTRSGSRPKKCQSRAARQSRAPSQVVWRLIACSTSCPRPVSTQAFGAPRACPAPVFSISPSRSKRVSSLEI